MFLPVFVCLSVCLLARLLKNACMDLDEMLRVNKINSPGNSPGAVSIEELGEPERK